MLKPTKMTRIHISGSKDVLDQVIRVSHSHKALHIVDYDNGLEDFDIGSPLEGASDYSRDLVEIRSMISFLGPGDRKCENIKDADAAKSTFTKISTEFKGLLGQKDTLESRIKEIEDIRNQFGPLSALGLPSDTFCGYEAVHAFCGFVREPIEKDVKKITNQYELYEAKHDKNIVFALFVPTDKAKEAAELLQKKGYLELPIPESEVDIPALTKEEKKLHSQLDSLALKFKNIKKQHLPFLKGYENYLKEENEKAEVPLRFATTENAFVIDGWVPSGKLDKIVKSLREKTNGKVSIEAFKETEDAPVALNNPRSVQPFEFFLDLYSIPHYLEIDPTAVMFFTFPLFFGFMLGDIGYGIITLALFFGLSLKFKGEMKALLNALIIASLATITFGFIFGEFFGLQVIEHPILHRAHDLTTMMLISIVVGFIHINLGYLFGFINTYKEHGLMEAIFEKASWVVIELGIILLGAHYMGYIAMPEMMYIGGGVTLLGVAMLIKGEGPTGIIELPALLSNTLSYARLFAVGLASVSLALVVNNFATQFFSQGGLYIIPAIFILVAGHALNIALGILGPFLHSLRLHYVEFFTKFYKGGGKKYTPFGI